MSSWACPDHTFIRTQQEVLQIKTNEQTKQKTTTNVKKMRNDAQTKEILRVPPLSFILCELVLSFRSSSSTVSISLCTVKTLLLLLSILLSPSLCSFHFILFIIGFDCLQKEKWEKNRSFSATRVCFQCKLSFVQMCLAHTHQQKRPPLPPWGERNGQ